MLYHATPLKNIKSIFKKGLLPYHHTSMYNDKNIPKEYIPQYCNGVYLAEDPEEAKGIVKEIYNGKIAVLAVDVNINECIPDEDVEKGWCADNRWVYIGTIEVDKLTIDSYYSDEF